MIKMLKIPWSQSHSEAHSLEHTVSKTVEEQMQRREYSRVDAYIPFDYRIVADDEKGHIQARISGDTATSEFRPIDNIGDYDYIFGEWLKILNAKLDTVIRLMTLQREGYFGLPFKTINIHVYAILGGINFPILGPVIGSLIMTFVPEFLRITEGVEPIFTGILMILLVLCLPDGLLGLTHLWQRRSKPS